MGAIAFCSHEEATPWDLMCGECKNEKLKNVLILKSVINSVLDQMNNSLYHHASPFMQLKSTVECFFEVIEHLPAAWFEWVDYYLIKIDYRVQFGPREHSDEAKSVLKNQVDAILDTINRNQHKTIDEQLNLCLRECNHLLQHLVSVFQKNETTNLAEGGDAYLQLQYDFEWADTYVRIPGSPDYRLKLPLVPNTSNRMFELDRDTNADGSCQFDAIWRQILGQRLYREYPDMVLRAKTGNFDRMALKLEILECVKRNRKRFEEVTINPHASSEEDRLSYTMFEIDGDDGCEKLVRFDEWFEFIKKPGSEGTQHTLVGASILLKRNIVVFRYDGTVNVIKNYSNISKKPIVIAYVPGHYHSLKLINEQTPPYNCRQWNADTKTGASAPESESKLQKEVEGLLSADVSIEDIKKNKNYTDSIIAKALAAVKSLAASTRQETGGQTRGRGGQIRGRGAGRGRGFVVERGERGRGIEVGRVRGRGRRGRGGRGTLSPIPENIDMILLNDSKSK